MKIVIIHKFPRDSGITLTEVTRYMEDYSRRYPRRQVFFDGDQYAVCYIKD